MNGSTKILTVSYGTFSCTLEGFDDPLGSMRDIAEYFRDLASDDRYFGAEPPTPDVEMLQRIAEKEVKRRVEARVSDTGVQLVAAPNADSVQDDAPAEDAAQDTVDMAPESAPADIPTVEGDRGPLTFDDDFLMSDEPEDVLAVDPNATVSQPAPAESVAEKLRRIRAVVSRNNETNTEALRQEQAPNAGNPELRNRALTRTIQQIQNDLTDDEDAPAANVLAEPEQSFDEPEQSGSAPDVDWEFETEAAFDSADEDTVQAEADEEADDDVETDDQSLSKMLGQVAERIASDETVEAGSNKNADPKDRATSRTLSPEPEADVGRLLDETDSKLNDNETVRRRRVISQMRAAVAATKADRLVSNQMSKEDQEEAEKDPYREDLSEAVEDTPVSARQPSTPPLVLVSSQRINTEVREVRAKVAEFAAEFGAKDLPELMEAAAAFTIFSEGQPSFTRPEIMQLVTRMDPSLELSREESLRSFGQLLRDGTFKKLERGQFTIDSGTKYNPEQRAAEG